MLLTVHVQQLNPSLDNDIYTFRPQIINYDTTGRVSKMDFIIPIIKLSGLAGGSSVSQLVADHVSFSDTKLGVITDVTPLTVVVDLDPSRGI